MTMEHSDGSVSKTVVNCGVHPIQRGAQLGPLEGRRVKADRVSCDIVMQKRRAIWEVCIPTVSSFARRNKIFSVQGRESFKVITKTITNNYNAPLQILKICNFYHDKFFLFEFYRNNR